MSHNLPLFYNIKVLQRKCGFKGCRFVGCVRGAKVNNRGLIAPPKNRDMDVNQNTLINSITVNMR
jgi:hypothetical protein